MPISRIIAAEGNVSSSQDELNMLISVLSMRRLGQAVINRMYNNHNALFNRLINSSPYAGEYNFGIVQRAFAEFHVVSTTMRPNNQPRYFGQTYNYSGVDLYLSGEWYAIYHAQPTVHANWPSINDLVRVLNTCFNANFVYIVSDGRHQLWGPSGTL